jgi:hypothetical protein
LKNIEGRKNFAIITRELMGAILPHPKTARIIAVLEKR